MSTVIASSLMNEAVGKAETVDRLVRNLCHALREIHGGEWFMLIDHGRQFVMVYQEVEDGKLPRPTRGEVV